MLGYETRRTVRDGNGRFFHSDSPTDPNTRGCCVRCLEVGLLTYSLYFLGLPVSWLMNQMHSTFVLNLRSICASICAQHLVEMLDTVACSRNMADYSGGSAPDLHWFPITFKNKQCIGLSNMAFFVKRVKQSCLFKT